MAPANELCQAPQFLPARTHHAGTAHTTSPRQRIKTDGNVYSEDKTSIPSRRSAGGGQQACWCAGRRLLRSGHTMVAVTVAHSLFSPLLAAAAAAVVVVVVVVAAAAKARARARAGRATESAPRRARGRSGSGQGHSQRQGQRQGEWDCSVHAAHNFALRSLCFFKCGERKPAGAWP
jgi:hypothetical protein